MKLTDHTTAAILSVPCCCKVGLGTPFVIGAKTPLFFRVVFSFLPAVLVTGLIRAKFVMTGSHGKPLRLAAPVSGILTPFSPAANTVRSIGWRHFNFLQEQVA